MIFRGDKGTERLEKQMAAWELGAYDYALNHYKSDVLDIMVRIGREDGRRKENFRLWERKYWIRR